MYLDYDATLLLFLGMAITGLAIIVFLDRRRINDKDSKLLARCMVIVGLIVPTVVIFNTSTKTSAIVIKDIRVQRNYCVEPYFYNDVHIQATDQNGRSRNVVTEQIVHNSMDPSIQKIKITITNCALHNFLRSSHTKTETVMNLPYTQ